MATQNVKQLDTSAAAIDSTEDQVFKIGIMDYHGDGDSLDFNEREQAPGKIDSESASRKSSRRVKK
jgi:hypothetical protein